jgi:hypothetical protein
MFTAPEKHLQETPKVEVEEGRGSSGQWMLCFTYFQFFFSLSLPGTDHPSAFPFSYNILVTSENPPMKTVGEKEDKRTQERYAERETKLFSKFKALLACSSTVRGDF